MNKMIILLKFIEYYLIEQNFKSLMKMFIKLFCMQKIKLLGLYLNFKNFNLISVDVYNFLFVSESTPGILYGLPKTHKNGNPIRPIFSAIGTPAYKISKFFVPILNKLTTNLYTINNSFSFVDYLSKISNVDNLFMVSFDVESLFTNIPLQETIDICTKLN